MMTEAGKMIYFPPYLRQALNSIEEQPLTLISAGSGFGKTTAVAGRLEHCPPEIQSRWYTCFGEPPERAWAGICRLIAFADAKVGEHLSKTELPTVDHLGYIASLMEEINCEKETVLVVDNYQLAGFSEPFRLLDALAAHNCPRLHIVVLSHPIYAESSLFPTNPRIRQISQDVFCFNAGDVGKLFSRFGIELSNEDAEKLTERTGGWIAALRLYLTGFLAGNSLMESTGLGDLLEQAFWRRLSEREQNLFLGLSLLDHFTEAEATRMLGGEVMPEYLWASVRHNSFVREESGHYILHTLLKDFLTAKLQTIPESLQKQLWQRAGTACEVQGNRVEALLFYYLAGDDTAAVSIPLTSLERAELVRNHTQAIGELLGRCRIEALVGRWLLLQDIAVKAGLNGKLTLARTATVRLTELRDMEQGDTVGRLNAGAALELMASFRAYNDLSEMNRHYAVIVDMLPDPRDFYLPNDSWTFCAPSVAYLFWRESGSFENDVFQLRKTSPNYALLSGGKGLGAPEIMTAEAMLFAGKEKESATVAYQALAIAKSNGQDSVIFCCHTLLARLAILQGNVTAFRAAVEEIRNLAFTGKEFLCLTAAETALGFLYSLLEQEDDIPVWLLDADSVRKTLYPVTTPFALIVTLRHLCRQSPSELIGTADAYIKESAERHNFMPQLYFMLEQVAFYERGGKREQAVEKLNRILTLALPDQAYLPISEYYGAIAPVLNDPALICTDAPALECIHTLGRKFVNGTAAIRAALSNIFPLTPREREMAKLAQSRLTTIEIAEKLSVSPATVKNTLNKVYAKLDIKGKTELADMQL